MSQSKKVLQLLMALLLCSLAGFVVAAPKLNFTDLANGPATGLGDGKGSGVIVTLWGQKLGSSKGSSKVFFRDATGASKEVAHYYYWKNADGQLPGGPSNLSDSHNMQEIAVSVPASAAGSGEFYVKVNGQTSNTLPFLVRSGRIFHVSPSGSNANPGTYAQPWRTVSMNSGGALAKNIAGDVIYSHGVVDAETTQTTAYYGVGMYSNRTPGTLSNQTAIASYPGTQARIESYHFGFDVDRTRAFVLSKYKVLTGNHVEPSASSTTPLSISATVSAGIQGSADGRVVGNYVGDLPGRCVSSQSGGIVANHNSGYDYVSNLKVFGNQVEDYGCPQTSRYQHTTYFSVRWGVTVSPFELGWNHLNGNMADGGLYLYDERGNGQSSCGNFNGPLHVHNNVIVDQRGAAVVIGTNGGSPCWTNDIHLYNNVLLNTGKGPNLLESNVNIGASALWFWGGSYTGTVKVFNNHIEGFGDSGFNHGPQAAIGLSGWGDAHHLEFNNNVVIRDITRAYWVDVTGGGYGDALLDDMSGSNNLFYSNGVATLAAPSWARNSILNAPQIEPAAGLMLRVGAKSPAIGSGLALGLSHDIYGNARTSNSIGAVVPADAIVVYSAPEAPPGLRIE